MILTVKLAWSNYHPNYCRQINCYFGEWLLSEQLSPAELSFDKCYWRNPRYGAFTAGAIVGAFTAGAIVGAFGEHLSLEQVSPEYLSLEQFSPEQ